jgi:Zn-dependent protease with chaperone function
MFVNLFSLMIVLLFLGFVPEAHPFMEMSPYSALGAGVLLYIGALAVIAALGLLAYKKMQGCSSMLTMCAQGVNIASIIVFHMVVGGHSIYWSGEGVVYSYVLGSVITMAMYFGGLFCYYNFSLRRHGQSIRAVSHRAVMNVRFLLPFVVPFLFFAVLSDVAAFIPIQEYYRSIVPIESQGYDLLVTTVGMVLFLSSLLVFFPVVLQRLWGCSTIEEGPLRRRLEALCEKASFKCAGIKVWTVMNSAMTAAVMGIAPSFRYVMFTRRLLMTLSPPQVEAVLAHEIGHSKHKHLFFYPFIVAGFIVITALFSLICGEALQHYLNLTVLVDTSRSAVTMYSLLLFVGYALFLMVYFRLVFGVFSRNFERQADLTIFALGIPPQHMIEALDVVAEENGGIHDEANWHHHSIRERMDFLLIAEKEPSLVVRHAKRVRRLVAIYLLILAVGAFIAFVPSLPENNITAPLVRGVKKVAMGIRDSGVVYKRERVAQHLAGQYDMEDEGAIAALSVGLQRYAGDSVPGVAEFYAAQILLKDEAVAASMRTIIQAWQRFDFGENDPSVREDFRWLSVEILDAARRDASLGEASRDLMKLMEK